MLHDRARIHVQAGAGGDGCMSFRREAHVPRGGPDGGDGGRGGDVVLVCDDSLRDLQSFRRRTHYRAGRGGHGEGALRHGADGETLLDPRCRRGRRSTARRARTGDLAGRRWELLAAGQRARSRAAAAAGKGNKRFATPTRQAPRFAERGLPGEEGWLELRLKLLADVGLVGLPNAGKSSLLARLTRAAPKVADYPFTTLSPVLGVLEGEERQLVVADIPGLIEGASEGAGLGHDFLAHVERTRLLVHVLDIAPELSLGEGADALANHATIERELAAHDERLARLPRVLALSKADLVTDERAREAVARVASAARPGGARDRHLERHRRWARGARGRAAAAVVPAPSAAVRRRTAAGGRRPTGDRRGGAGRAHGLPPGGRQRAFRSSGSGRGSFAVSGQGHRAAARSATTSTTRTRWPTSRAGCGGSACCGRSRRRASSPATRSRSRA